LDKLIVLIALTNEPPGDYLAHLQLLATRQRFAALFGTEDRRFMLTTDWPVIVVGIGPDAQGLLLDKAAEGVRSIVQTSHYYDHLRPLPSSAGASPHMANGDAGCWR
jgi:hypothetical protein